MPCSPTQTLPLHTLPEAPVHVVPSALPVQKGAANNQKTHTITLYLAPGQADKNHLTHQCFY
jgi:hypothetical protein